jgi:hypothetical protein
MQHWYNDTDGKIKVLGGGEKKICSGATFFSLWHNSPIGARAA